MVEVGLQRPIDAKILNKTIPAIPDVVSTEKKDGNNLRIRFNGGLDVQERILSDLVRLNIGVISYRPASSDLEDAYLKLVKSTV